MLAESRLPDDPGVMMQAVMAKALPRKPGLLDALRQRPLVADGAMGTQLYERGHPINRSFDEANLATPDMVKAVHAAYVRAGSNLLETNTYSANRVLLGRYGLADKVEAINRTAVRLAREASAEGVDVYVAGSIGPTGEGSAVIPEAIAADIESAFDQQIAVLVDEGVDALLFETFHHLAEMEIALKVAKARFSGPIIAQMSFEEDGKLRDGTPPETVAAILVHAGADVVGVNCCDGPSVVLDVATAMLTQAPLVSALPNAGQPRRIDARTIYMATPEYFGIYARRFMKAGVRLVGGCCGTGVDHIRAMAGAARMMSGGQVPVESAAKLSARPGTTVQAARDPVPLAERSRFAAKIDRVWRERLGSGTIARAPKDRSEFVVSVEVNPAHGLDATRPTEIASMLVGGGVDVVNIADGPRAVLRMSNTALGKHIMDTLGIEVLLHVCCRDRNLLGLQMDLLGDHVLGYRNLVVITGDPPKLGDFPKATAVFDVDSIGLLRLADGLNRGIDPTGKGIDGRTSFLLACGAEPAALDYKREMARLEKKIEAGADLIMTQPVYDGDVVERFLDDVKRFGVPVLLGICPLASSRNAEFLHHEVPGMTIPDAIRERMRKAAPGAEAQAEGVAIARDMLTRFMDRVVGTYIMPQVGRYRAALDVLAPLGYGTPE